MRVAYELTALNLDRGGTSRAIEHTLPILKADPRVEIVEVAHHRRGGRLLGGLARELVYFPHTLPKQVARENVSVLHCPSQLAPPSCPVPVIVTIHDAIGWEHPEWLTRSNVAQLTRRLPLAIAAGAEIITSSDYSRRKLIEALAVDPTRIHTVPLGVDKRFTSVASQKDSEFLDELEVRSPYLFSVGTLQPRKNFGAVLEAFELLAEQHADLQLVVAGARGWRDEDLMMRLASSGVANRVRVLGRVSDLQLAALYRRAEVFVFASRYEGFGFPPLEAMASGTPVASTTATSLAEILGDAAVELDPDSSEQIAESVDRLLTSDDLCREHVDMGIENASRFTWRSTADRIVEIYEIVASR